MALRKEFCNGQYLLLSIEVSIAEPEEWDECTLGCMTPMAEKATVSSVMFHMHKST
jgi:hypothetical protein